MNQDEVIERMKSINKRMFDEIRKGDTSPEIPQEEQPITGTDYYQDGIIERRELSKKQFPRGSRQKVAVDARELTDGLRCAYKRAKDDSDYSAKIGDKQRARLIKQQYMDENFLPAVDALVRLNSADEVLNNKAALDSYDEMVLIDGGSGSGYTRSYIYSAYGDMRGKMPGMSDAGVRQSVCRIMSLVDDDQIRAAVGVANQIKNKIDSGDAMASDEDYEIISRVVARGM